MSSFESWVRANPVLSGAAFLIILFILWMWLKREKQDQAVSDATKDLNSASAEKLTVPNPGGTPSTWWFYASTIDALIEALDYPGSMWAQASMRDILALINRQGLKKNTYGALQVAFANRVQAKYPHFKNPSLKDALGKISYSWDWNLYRDEFGGEYWESPEDWFVRMLK